MLKKRNENGPHTPGSFFEHTQHFSTDAACREFLERERWPNGPVCPRKDCGSTKAYKLQGKSTRPGVYKCASCRKPFTVTVGTIYEDTHIPLPKWFAATYLMMTSKKGVSANQVGRMMGISNESAWYMMQRIRKSLEKRIKLKTMRGTVEVDETYIGGRTPGKPGRSRSSKVPVVALVQRGGRVRAVPVKDATKQTLHRLIRENVYDRAKVFTDDFASYIGLRKKYDHRRVNHSKKEYVRVDKDGVKVHTNTVEGFFANFKRAVHGIFHHVSPQKLPLYLDEFCFRYDHRKIKDAARFEQAFKDVSGRLTWYFKIGGIMKGCRLLQGS